MNDKNKATPPAERREHVRARKPFRTDEAYIEHLRAEQAAGRYTAKVPTIYSLRKWRSEEKRPADRGAGTDRADIKAASGMHVSCPIHLVGPLLKAFYEQHRRDHEGMEPALRQLAEEATRLYHDNVKGAKPGWVATWEFLNRWRGWYVDIGAAARKRKVAEAPHQDATTAALVSADVGEAKEEEPLSRPLACMQLDSGKKARVSASPPRPSLLDGYHPLVLAMDTGGAEEEEQEKEAEKDGGSTLLPADLKLRVWTDPKPPTFPHGADHRQGYARVLSVMTANSVGVVGSLRWSTYRLVEGVPRPYMSGGFKQLMEEALEVVFDWVRANKEAIEARYGPFQEDRDPCLHSMLLSFTNHLFPGTGASGSCMMAAALVAHALGTTIRPEVVVTGELTLSGYVLGVSSVCSKVLAAAKDPEVRVVGLSVDNFIDAGRLRDFLPAEEVKCYRDLEAKGLRASGLHLYRADEHERQQRESKGVAHLPLANRVVVDARWVSGALVGLPIELPGNTPVLQKRMGDGTLRVEGVQNMWEVLRLTLDKQPIVELPAFEHPMGSVCKVTSMFLLERQGVMQAVECCRTNRANNEGILLTGGAAQGGLSCVNQARAFVSSHVAQIRESLGDFSSYPALNERDFGVHDFPLLHVHFPNISMRKLFPLGAAVAVAMIGVLSGRQPSRTTAVMGELHVGGEFLRVPPFLDCHISAISHAGITRLFVPIPNVDTLRALVQQRQLQLEVVGMDNLLTALSDIFAVPVPNNQ